MTAANFSIEIIGLEALKANIGSDAVDRQLVAAVGRVGMQVHNAMRSAVSRTFAGTHDLNAALVGKSTSTLKFGTNFIENNLVYRDKPHDLSKFPTDYYKGNINSSATREGNVHTVIVKKGNAPKVVYGKDHHGGFIPRYEPKDKETKGKVKLFTHKSNGKSKIVGAQMFERTTNQRYPLRLLFGPNLSDMAANVYSNDAEVRAVLDKSAETIAAYLFEKS